MFQNKTRNISRVYGVIAHEDVGSIMTVPNSSRVIRQLPSNTHANGEQADFWRRQDIEPILSKLEQIMKAAEWEDEDEVGPNALTADRARTIIKTILTSLYAKGQIVGRIPRPDVGITPEGGIHFAWKLEKRVINLNVLNKGNENSLIVRESNNKPTRRIFTDKEVVGSVIDLLIP